MHNDKSSIFLLSINHELSSSNASPAYSPHSVREHLCIFICPFEPTMGIPSSNKGGRALVVVSFVLLFLEILSVSARLWARRLKKKGFALDDYLIVMAFVCVHAPVLLPESDCCRLLPSLSLSSVP